MSETNTEVLFTDFKLSAELNNALTDMGFVSPTPIQALSIPAIQQGYDVMAQAQTGTGKTAAFSLPTLNMIQENGRPGIQMLVLTPTRELAQQVSGELQKLSKYLKYPIATIIGGKSYRDQHASIKKAKVLIATPGRLVDLMESGALPNFAPQFFVLDEADRMLDMGFADDLEKIVANLPEERQTLLFSATFAVAVKKLAQKIQKEDRKFIKVEANEETNPDIEQFAFVMIEDEKDVALYRLIDYYDPQKAIIFCEMKRDADRLGTQLNRKGYKAQILHGDTEQKKREEIMASFRRMKKGILVATDLAGRGLDVSDISHVINFQIPYSRDSYIHRIGRTGRAGNKGVAFNLASKRELFQLQRWAESNRSSIKVMPVPTLTALRRKAMESLKETLLATEPSVASLEAMTQLSDTMDIAQLASRLLEIQIKGLHLSGPEKLGMTEEDLRRPSSARGGHAPRGHQRQERGSRGSYPPRRFNREEGEGRRSFSGEGRSERSEGGFSRRRRDDNFGERSEGRSERRSEGGSFPPRRRRDEGRKSIRSERQATRHSR